jgi:DNA processing protein
MAEHLVAGGYTVVSGLARGIDHAAHTTALAAGGRTVAVIGTGIRRCYPPEHADLQRHVAAVGAVVSQFLPDRGPTRDSFPMRNAVMSGLALATVIVEAGRASGARVQARCALAHGRPVFLRRELTAQQWAGELAGRPGVHLISTPRDVTRTVERLTATEALTA